MTIQSDATTKLIAETEPWFMYDDELRAGTLNPQHLVLAAPLEGGPVMLYVRPGPGKIITGVTVGPFHKSDPSEPYSYKPQIIYYTNHQITPELDKNFRTYLTYHCETCQLPVYWDGVFEGKWFHTPTPHN